MQKYAIAGLGVTPQGVIPGTSAEKLAWDAVELALSDAGLQRKQIDGYIYQPGFGERTSGKAASRASLGAGHATLHVDSSGATGIFTLIAAIGMLEAGTADYVVCVHATNARSQTVTVGAGEKDQNSIFGFFSPGSKLLSWREDICISIAGLLLIWQRLRLLCAQMQSRGTMPICSNVRSP